MGKNVSVALALEDLERLSEDVRAKHQAYLASMETRDEAIRDCRRGRIPFAVLMRKTKLSRDRLAKIASTLDPDEG